MAFFLVATHPVVRGVRIHHNFATDDGTLRVEKDFRACFFRHFLEFLEVALCMAVVFHDALVFRVLFLLFELLDELFDLVFLDLLVFG